jgi:hypothetical protein
MAYQLAFQRLIAAKAIGVIDRAFPGLLSNVLHQVLSAHTFDDFRINVPFALQQAENKALSGCASATFPLSLTAKVSFIKFNLATQATGLKLSNVVETFSQGLIDTETVFCSSFTSEAKR